MSAKQITMQGPEKISIPMLSNFEAGILALHAANHYSPGITFGQLANAVDLARLEQMSGLTSFFKSVGNSVVSTVGNLKDGLGDVLKDTGTYIGDKAGDAVRLVTDQKVIDGAASIGAAYATSGGSAGVKALLDGKGGDTKSSNGVIDFISSLGAALKGQAAKAENAVNQSGMENYMPWLVGGAAFVALFVLGRKT